jgi:hypothetical protein
LQATLRMLPEAFPAVRGCAIVTIDHKYYESIFNLE